MKVNKMMITTLIFLLISITLYIYSPKMFLCGIGGEKILSDGKNYGKILDQSIGRVEKFSDYRVENTPIFINEDFFGATYVFPHRSCMYIGNNGKNVDVISHELMHSLIAKKVGYFDFTFNIPAWLDEGIAMQVDNREQYLEIDFQDNTASYIKKIIKRKEFYSGGEERVIKNYSASKYVVAELLRTSSFEELLADY